MGVKISFREGKTVIYADQRGWPISECFYQRISQGSSRSLALYCLGSHETQREASVTQDGE
jgi:hypothetical protein